MIMLSRVFFCVIPQILYYVFNNSNGAYRQQVDTVIKILFMYLYSDGLYDTIDTFWSEYNNFLST